MKIDRVDAGGGLQPDDYAWILERLRWASRWLQLIAGDLRSSVRLPPGRVLRGWSRGFSRLANLVYGLDRRDASLFVSSFQQQVSSLKINGYLDHLINNKFLLPHLMKSIGLETPPVLAVRRDRRWWAEEGGPIRDFPRRLNDILAVRKKVVIKPAKGHMGRGVVFIARSDEAAGGGAETRNPEAALPRRRDLVMTGFVEQADYARALYPETTNSIRLLTAWDVVKREPFVAAAAQRIGTRRSFPVDNWREGLGGLCSEVDLETGRLGPGAAVQDGRRVVWHGRHPETGAPIEGGTVPDWGVIKREIVRGAGALAVTPLLGWDILVTREGYCVLEINGPPGLYVHQVHRPLLGDPRLRRFYGEFGIVRKAGHRRT